MRKMDGNVTKIIEFYIPGVLNLIQFCAIAFRKRKISTAGHSYHRDFPYSVKVKMLFVSLWLVITLATGLLVVVSTENHNFWLL